MSAEIPRIRPQTRRFRQTLARLEAFMRDVLANTDAELPTVFQDAFDAHLNGLDIDMDFPAVAVPAWMAFRTRYVSDVTGGLIETSDSENRDEIAADAIELVEEVRTLVESETGRHEDRDREAFYSADPSSRFLNQPS